MDKRVVKYITECDWCGEEIDRSINPNPPGLEGYNNPDPEKHKAEGIFMHGMLEGARLYFCDVDERQKYIDKNYPKDCEPIYYV